MLCWIDFVHSLAQCPVVYGDIVATSNGDYPLGQNLYQTPKTVATAESCVSEDGVIIMVASCVDGMGGTFFEKLIVQGSVEEIDKYLSHIPPKETISEQWCVQIYSTRQTVRVDADIVIPPGGEVMIASPHGVTGAAKVRELLPDGTLRRKPHEKKNKV